MRFGDAGDPATARFGDRPQRGSRESALRHLVRAD